MASHNSGTEAPQPFIAACRPLSWQAPLRWLRLGWRDLTRAPATSLSYGAAMVLLSYAITGATWYLGNLGLYLGVLSGFVFLGPVLALTLYAVSARLAGGAPVSLALTLRDACSALRDAMVFALLLLVVFLIWARAAMMLFIFFPVDGETGLADRLVFLAIGSAVGALFAGLIFMASTFSLPMMLDRRSDSITAVLSSIHATLRNKPAMALWAACIAGFVLAGVATFYIGFAVLLPWLGHAAWHAYRETIDARPWPQRPLSVAAR